MDKEIEDGRRNLMIVGHGKTKTKSREGEISRKDMDERTDERVEVKNLWE